MSVQSRPKRLTVTQIQGRKGGDKLVCLTAYTASVARLIDREVDLLLVGDSLAMTVYGFDSTLPVSLELMIAHGAAVVRSTEHALVTVDLPFGSYQASPEDAFRAAARVLAETGCAAVKLEGGEEMAETVAFLTRRGVPVMGHVGLTPQAVNALGGYRSRGHAAEEHRKIMQGGVAIAEAGAFSLVIEGVAESLARELTSAVPVPTIGIGGSPACDGQILVIDDMLGLFTEFTPRFVKRYRQLGDDIRMAAREYADEVRKGRFPAAEHTYPAPTAQNPPPRSRQDRIPDGASNRDSGTLRGRRAPGPRRGRLASGRSSVRAALFMPAMVASKKNPVIAPYYEKLRAAGKSAKQALTACMRKLLVILNAILRDRKPWQPA